MKLKLIGLLATLGILLVPFASQALTISPVTLQLAADPGATVGGELTLENDQTEEKTYTSSIQEFKEGEGETGQPKFDTATTGISSWISTAESMTLKPGERKTVPFTLTVPADARPGGHFASIFWNTGGSGDSDVSVEARLGTLVFLSVSGNIVESGKVLEFGNPDGKGMFSTRPVDLFYRFQNTGNDRIVPKGTITVKNMLGSVKETMDANTGEGSVLPGGIRRFEFSWDPRGYGEQTSNFFKALGREISGFSFGKYSAELSLSYGLQTPQTATSTYSFWMFPWRTLLVLLIVIVLILWLWMWAKKRKKGAVK